MKFSLNLLEYFQHLFSVIFRNNLLNLFELFSQTFLAIGLVLFRLIVQLEISFSCLLHGVLFEIYLEAAVLLVMSN